MIKETLFSSSLLTQITSSIFIDTLFFFFPNSAVCPFSLDGQSVNNEKIINYISLIFSVVEVLQIQYSKRSTLHITRL